MQSEVQLMKMKKADLIKMIMGDQSKVEVLKEIKTEPVVEKKPEPVAEPKEIKQTLQVGQAALRSDIRNIIKKIARGKSPEEREKLKQAYLPDAEAKVVDIIEIISGKKAVGGKPSNRAVIERQEYGKLNAQVKDAIHGIKHTRKPRKLHVQDSTPEQRLEANVELGVTNLTN